tara:strand:- start:138 stop:446 length:309 start_codon:yes stop_codon:yes gene_type:complete
MDSYFDKLLITQPTNDFNIFIKYIKTPEGFISFIVLIIATVLAIILNSLTNEEEKIKLRPIKHALVIFIITFITNYLGTEFNLVFIPALLAGIIAFALALRD